MKLRVGVIGCGLISQIAHLPYLRELTREFEISALCDLSPSLVNQLGVQYNVSQRFTDYRDLLNQDLDAVFILTRDHAPAALEAIDRNIHVFIEKPLCFNLEEAERIIENSRRNKVIVMVGYMKRYDPSYERALELLQQMDGDKLIRVHSSVGNPNRITQEIFDLIQATDIPEEQLITGKKNADAKLLKAIGEERKEYLTTYSLLLHLWSHDINILRGAFGDPKDVNYAEIKIGESGNSMPFVQILAVLDYGAQASCIWDTQAFVVNEWWDEKLEIFGKDLTIKLSFPNPYLKNAPTMLKIEDTQDGALIEQKIISSYSEAYKRELKHFHHCIDTGKQPLTNAEDGKKDLEFAINLLKKEK
jgi:predicted dehydrogenase